jgi:hypothetical protein
MLPLDVNALPSGVSSRSGCPGCPVTRWLGGVVALLSLVRAGLGLLAVDSALDRVAPILFMPARRKPRRPALTAVHLVRVWNPYSALAPPRSSQDATSLQTPPPGLGWDGGSRSVPRQHTATTQRSRGSGASSPGRAPRRCARPLPAIRGLLDRVMPAAVARTSGRTGIVTV